MSRQFAHRHCRWPAAAQLAWQPYPQPLPKDADFAHWKLPVQALPRSGRRLVAAALAGLRVSPPPGAGLWRSVRPQPGLVQVFLPHAPAPRAAVAALPHGRSFSAVDRSCSPPRIHFFTGHESTSGMSLEGDEPWQANRSLPVSSEAADRRDVELTVHCRRVRSKYGERVNVPPAANPAAGGTQAKRWYHRIRRSSTARH